MYMNGCYNLDSHFSRYFTDFILKSGYDPKNVRLVSVEDLPFVEEIVQKNILYTISISNKENMREN